MPDINAVNNSFASAPQSFTQKDRAEELRDARQPVSQVDSRNLAQNDTVNTDQRANSATTVFAANGSSDSNNSRSTATAASSEEVSSQGASLQRTADAFEEQLQRANLERQSRPAEQPEPQEPAVNAQQTPAVATREAESRYEPQRADADRDNVRLQSPESEQTPSNRRAVADEQTESRAAEAAEEPAAVTERRSVESSSDLESPPERENAEEALGLS